jgi:serine protease Do
VKTRVVAHGTAFGYRHASGGTLLVTNEHVARWPAVTTAEHVVEGVPPGCKRTAESLRIVDDDRDAYERDDIPLSTVVADGRLDAAVLRAAALLPIMPWKMGRSSALAERNVVEVRGFPLGVLRASSVGQVIAARDRDEERDWGHDDFVIDSLLSQGSSGSPVFAISCRTGEFELVGVFHAAYEGGGPLNVVVGIDELRTLLHTLKRPPIAREGEVTALDPSAREIVLRDARASHGSFFPFGTATAAIHPRQDGALVFEVLPREFPLRRNPVLVFEDLPPRGAAFGKLGRLWAGNRQGLRQVKVGLLDADTRQVVSRVLDALRRDAVLAASYRAASRQSFSSRDRFKEVARLERAVRRRATSRQDLTQAMFETADRLCPALAEAPEALSVALTTEPPEREPKRRAVTSSIPEHRRSSSSGTTRRGEPACVSP